MVIIWSRRAGQPFVKESGFSPVRYPGIEPTARHQMGSDSFSPRRRTHFGTVAGTLMFINIGLIRGEVVGPHVNQ